MFLSKLHDLLQSHIRQPLSMCRQYFIRGQTKNSIKREPPILSVFFLLFFVTIYIMICDMEEGRDGGESSQAISSIRTQNLGYKNVNN